MKSSVQPVLCLRTKQVNAAVKIAAYCVSLGEFMKSNKAFERVIHGIFLILGLVTVACVLLITVYLVISGIPAIMDLFLGMACSQPHDRAVATKRGRRKHVDEKYQRTEQ